MDGVADITFVMWIDCDDSALCALMVDGDGAFWAALNRRWGERAMQHAERHAKEGVVGYLVCSADACGVMRPSVRA